MKKGKKLPDYLGIEVLQYRGHWKRECYVLPFEEEEEEEEEEEDNEKQN